MNNLHSLKCDQSKKLLKWKNEAISSNTNLNNYSLMLSLPLVQARKLEGQFDHGIIERN